MATTALLLSKRYVPLLFFRIMRHLFAACAELCSTRSVGWAECWECHVCTAVQQDALGSRELQSLAVIATIHEVLRNLRLCLFGAWYVIEYMLTSAQGN